MTATRPIFSADLRPLRRRSGFTLMELIVVILIIVALIAISVPAIDHAKKLSKIAAQKQQLAGLRQALEAYYNDCGNVYPASNNPLDPTTPMYATAATPIRKGRGAAMLAQGLMGYMPPSIDGAGAPMDSFAYGFRTKGSASAGTATGKVYGPYGPDDPKVFVDNNNLYPAAVMTPNTDRSFIDIYGNEILYFRSTRTSVNRTGLNAVTRVFGTDLSSAGNNFYFYTDDNATAPDGTPRTAPDASADFLKLLGAASNDISTSAGNILGASSYILISPGPDGIPFTADDIVTAGQ